MKSDNDDRDEENQMELGNNTMSSNNNKYSDDDWDHNRKYEQKCKQIQKNFNVVDDDDDDVIKHNLSSIWKDKKQTNEKN